MSANGKKKTGAKDTAWCVARAKITFRTDAKITGWRAVAKAKMNGLFVSLCRVL